MVVDDNQDTLDAITAILQDVKHVVTALDNGTAALKFIEKPENRDAIDVVLLDIRLGNENGCEILGRIKSMAWMEHVPVVMISGLEDWDVIAKCIGAGADDYLTKPPRPTMLLSRMKNCLLRVRNYRDNDRAKRVLSQRSKERDGIIRSLFPKRIVPDVIGLNDITPKRYNDLAVMFCDIVGFTSYCDTHQDDPHKVVSKLRELFEKFEDAADAHNVDKIKTIGDCFMGACWPEDVNNNVESCIRAAQEMMKVAQGLDWKLRIGIHQGTVVAGKAGKKQYCFDLWGDTVNLAAHPRRSGRGFDRAQPSGVRSGPGFMPSQGPGLRRTAWQKRAGQALSVSSILGSRLRRFPF
ncbi:MAG: adenylate/guanylate cyclase domain-containing response regulator [Pirellulales bacterium]